MDCFFPWRTVRLFAGSGCSESACGSILYQFGSLALATLSHRTRVGAVRYYPRRTRSRQAPVRGTVGRENDQVHIKSGDRSVGVPKQRKDTSRPITLTCQQTKRRRFIGTMSSFHRQTLWTRHRFERESRQSRLLPRQGASAACAAKGNSKTKTRLIPILAVEKVSAVGGRGRQLLDFRLVWFS